MIKKIVVVCLLVVGTTLPDVTVTPTYVIRSQGRTSYRQLAGGFLLGVDYSVEEKIKNDEVQESHDPTEFWAAVSHSHKERIRSSKVEKETKKEEDQEGMIKPVTVATPGIAFKVHHFFKTLFTGKEPQELIEARREEIDQRKRNYEQEFALKREELKKREEERILQKEQELLYAEQKAQEEYEKNSSEPKWQLYVGISPGYQQSFDSDAISQCIFGSDICNGCIAVQGTNVSRRKSNAWMAENFYLSPDFNGSFSLSPKIKSFTLDADFYLGMDPLVRGMYVRISGPLCWTKWESNFCEKDAVGADTAGYNQGFFSTDMVGSSTLNATIADYMQGCAPTVSGLTIHGLQFAKVSCSADNTRVGFADLHLEYGWNYVPHDYYHLGINLQAVLPTGSKHDAEYLLNPMVGNGKHWGLGGGLSTHYEFAQSEDEQKVGIFYCDLGLVHLFNAYEERTYDLTNRPNSRYMLAQKMSGPIVNNLSTSSSSAATTLMPSAVNAQFANEYSPVANLTTASLKIGSAIEVDFTAMFVFKSRHADFQIGYNVWARSADKIGSSRTCSSTLSIFNENNNNVWALKGDSHVFGFASVTGGGLNANDPVPLSAAQSGASIRQGNNSLSTEANAQERNLNVDEAAFAYAGTNNQRLLYAKSLANSEANHIKTSVVTEFINFSNINLQPTRGLSHTVFVAGDYRWESRSGSSYFIGLGASAEFGIDKQSDLLPTNQETTFIDICDDKTITCSLSQWSVWLKGGFIFN